MTSNSRFLEHDFAAHLDLSTVCVVFDDHYLHNIIGCAHEQKAKQNYQLIGPHGRFLSRDINCIRLYEAATSLEMRHMARALTREWDTTVMLYEPSFGR